MKFILLMNGKIPTIIGILTFIGKINTMGVLKQNNSLFHTTLTLINGQLKFQSMKEVL